MPRAPKIDKPARAGDATVPSFEDALAQLEELVREMETDQIPLEDLIRKYEEGTRLYRVCEESLDAARGRIEVLRKKRNGETVSEPFGEESEATAVTQSGAPPTDGELF